ncbi:MAG: hypothetical protein ACOX69_05505 [Coriobacteriales bacterium]
MTGVFVVPDTDAHEVIVYVDNTLWTTELNMQAELYRAKLNIEIVRRKGQAPYADDEVSLDEIEQVHKLKFATSKERYISKRARQTTYEQLKEEEDEYKSIEPVALTPAEQEQIDEAVAGISDERLQRAAYRAAKASIEFQKGVEAHDRERAKSHRREHRS